MFLSLMGVVFSVILTAGLMLAGIQAFFLVFLFPFFFWPLGFRH